MTLYKISFTYSSHESQGGHQNFLQHVFFIRELIGKGLIAMQSDAAEVSE
ncbi:MAG: hypothetical protein FD166_3119 [Bacteroidetes bacterium]|nr:MAG: hypothetical protein FD166_3119 [Bacteroidota bacterium]